MLERIMITVCLAVIAIITVDALANIPLREFGIFECHYKAPVDVCVFSWRRFGLVAGNIAQGLITVVILCNAYYLRRRHLRERHNAATKD